MATMAIREAIELQRGYNAAASLHLETIVPSDGLSQKQRDELQRVYETAIQQLQAERAVSLQDALGTTQTPESQSYYSLNDDAPQRR